MKPTRINRTFMMALVSAAIALVAFFFVRQSTASEKENEIHRVGQDWQNMNMLSQDSYVRLRHLTDSAIQTGRMSDQDLDWSLSLMRGASSVPRARILGMLSVLRIVPDTQKARIASAISPFVAAHDELDRRYAARVQKMLSRANRP